MPLYIVRDDITRMKVDAIVSAGSVWSGTEAPAGGVEAQIHRAAGPELHRELRRRGGVRTGEATLTRGYALPCRYVIHTAGPVWQGGNHGEWMLLRACYLSSLRLAKGKGVASIAFPLIAAGTFGYPKQEALRVATAAIRSFLKEHDMDVHLVVYDRDAFQISRELNERVEQCIDDAYVEVEYVRRTLLEERWSYRRRRGDEAAAYSEGAAFEEHAAYDRTAPFHKEPYAGKTRWEIPDEDLTECGSPPDGNAAQAADCVPQKPLNLPSFMRRAADEDLLAETHQPRLTSGDTGSMRPLPAPDAVHDMPPVRELSPAMPAMRPVMPAKPAAAERPAGSPRRGKSLDELVGTLDESFSQMLLRLIDERGMKDSDCYHRANVDRKLFSKIRNTPNYAPRKQTAVAFAVSLQLSLEQTQELLSKAGLTLSRSNKFDVIVEYFISSGQYDVDVINQALFAYDQALLGSGMG